MRIAPGRKHARRLVECDPTHLGARDHFAVHLDDVATLDHAQTELSHDLPIHADPSREHQALGLPPRRASRTRQVLLNADPFRHRLLVDRVGAGLVFVRGYVVTACGESFAAGVVGPDGVIVLNGVVV